MLFRTQLLTGNQDVDNHILTLLEPKDLVSAIKCDKYTNKLAECETLWENRVNYWYPGAVMDKKKGISKAYIVSSKISSKLLRLKYRRFYIDLYKGKANAEYNCIKDVLDYLIKIGSYNDATDDDNDNLKVKCSGIASKETYNYLKKNNVDITSDDLEDILITSYPDPNHRLFDSLKWLDKELGDFSDYVENNEEDILEHIKDFDTKTFKFLVKRGLNVPLTLIDEIFPASRDTQIKMLTVIENSPDSELMDSWFSFQDGWDYTFKRAYQLINLFKKHSIILDAKEVNYLIEGLHGNCVNYVESIEFLQFLKDNNLKPTIEILEIANDWKEEIKELFF